MVKLFVNEICAIEINPGTYIYILILIHHLQDEQPKQPKPGGRVFVKRQECPLKNSEVEVVNHKHTRFHIVEDLPDYEKLRRSRMLMQLVVDDIRTNAVSKKKARAK